MGIVFEESRTNFSSKINDLSHNQNFNIPLLKGPVRYGLLGPYLINKIYSNVCSIVALFNLNVN